jgi:hypothetical protein
MYEEFDKQELERKLLYAKDAVFKMIMQFHRPSFIGDDGELYVYNYCESALEAAFNTLGIEENYIKLLDFCQMFEDNDRAIWAINAPYVPFNGITADIHYDIMKEEYERRERWLNNMDDVTLVYPECGDWEALYVDGELAKENHRISARQVLECLSKTFEFKPRYIETSDEVAEIGMPRLLSELEGQDEDY